MWHLNATLNLSGQYKCNLKSGDATFSLGVTKAHLALIQLSLLHTYYLQPRTTIGMTALMCGDLDGYNKTTEI